MESGEEQRPPEQGPPRRAGGWACLTGCAGLLVGLAAGVGLAGWLSGGGGSTARRTRDMLTVVERVVAPGFAPAFEGPGRSGVVDVLVNGSFATNYELLEEDYARIRAVLEPLGDVTGVRPVSCAEVASLERPRALPSYELTCELQLAGGGRRRFAFRFGVRAITLATWASLRSVRPVEGSD